MSPPEIKRRPEIIKRLRALKPPPEGSYGQEASAKLLVNMRPETVQRLEKLAAHFSGEIGHRIRPLQIVGVLIEMSAQRFN